MPGEILVPVGGTIDSTRALPIALALARALDAPGHLVRVLAVPSGPPSGTASALGAGTAVAATRSRVHDALAQAVDEMAAVGLRGSVAVLEGEDVTGELIGHARERDVRLIVMTTRASGPVKRALLGSVADRVVREAEMPVVLVPVEKGSEDGGRADTTEAITSALRAARPVRSILVPVDRSLDALRALEALRPAAAKAEEVVLLHVVVVESLVGIVSHPRADAGVSLERYVDAARRRLEEEAAPFRADVPALRVEVVEASNPGEAITAAARGRGVDLIAMSTRGDGALKRAVLGSTAAEVLRDAATPVLLVTTR